MKDYEIVIGLEVHAELNTESQRYIVIVRMRSGLK